MADLANPTNLGPITITPDSSNPVAAGAGGGTASSGGFCGGENRVSVDPCNSLHPAVAFDPFGNTGIVWHDNKDGNFEIYIRLLASQLDPAKLALVNQVFDPTTGKPVSLSCSSSSGVSGASGTSNLSTVIATQGGGRLDVNDTSQTLVLTFGNGTDFKTLGVAANDVVTILNGPNSGKSMTVRSVPAATVAQLNYITGLTSDVGFIYTISKSSAPLSSGEIRLTCNKGSSLFPDVVTDTAGRFHIVYQDNSLGNFEIYYIQVYPKAAGLLSCNGGVGGSIPAPVTGFAPLLVQSGGAPSTSSPTTDAPNSILIFNPGPPPTLVSFPTTGAVGSFFSFGDPLLRDPTPITDGPDLQRTGLHRLFKQGDWKGVSRASDRDVWNEQAAAAGITVQPDVIIPVGDPFAGLNDFGTSFSFKDVAFIAQTPPDKAVEIIKIKLPLKPHCLPPKNPATSNPDYQDLVSAPKTPVPTTFLDPVNLSEILTSPLVTLDQNVPPRFTVAGDTSGTVFTNILTDNGRGDLSRLVFTCGDGKGQDLRFILGQRQCGSELCAMPADAKGNNPDDPADNSNQYQITMQVWEGPDYRFLFNQNLSAQMSGAIKLSEKTFYFDAGEDITTFSYTKGELVAPDGRYLFFVPIAGNGVEFLIEGVGGGHEIWSTNEDGTFDQYYVPFTVQPNAGLNTPVYYEGFLDAPTSGVNFFPPGTQLKNDCSTASADASLDSGINVLPPSSTPILYYQYTDSTLHFDQQEIGPNVFATVPVTTVSSGSNQVPIDLDGPVINFGGTANVTGPLSATTIVQPFQITSDYGLMNVSAFLEMSNGFGTPTGTITCSVINASDIPSASGGGTFTSLGSASASISDLPINRGSFIAPKLVNFPVCTQLKAGSYAIVFAANVSATGGPGGFFVILNGSIRSITTPPPTGFGDTNIPHIPAATVAAVNGAALPSNGTQNFTTRSTTAYTIPERKVFANLLLSLHNGPLPVITTLSPLNTTTPTGATPPIPPPTLDVPPVPGAANGTGNLSNMIATPPLQLTRSSGDSVHPRIAIDSNNNIFLVFHSDRTGADEVYVGRFLGICGQWSTSNQGGTDFKLTNAGDNGKVAQFPNVATDGAGEAHIVYQSTDTDNGHSQVSYIRSTSAGSSYLQPKRISNSPAQAQMPDVIVSAQALLTTAQSCGGSTGSTTQGSGRVTVVWHDNRFGNYEILEAEKINGTWRSSGQGGTDTRITLAPNNSLYPRIAADRRGNLRVVYHDYRRGLDNPWIFMSTFVALADAWDSSGQGGRDMPITPTGTDASLFPDLDIDPLSGISIVWHDTRFKKESPDQHEEIMNSYCPKVDGPVGLCGPICTNVESFVSTMVNIVDCLTNVPIQVTNVPNVCLSITSPGATFYRAQNDGGDFSDWMPFEPGPTLDTAVVPWVLGPGSGNKSVCVQVQDSTTIGFPVCQSIVLQAPLPTFEIKFFKDVDLTIPLPIFKDEPVAAAGDVYVKLTSSTPLVSSPTFDVVSRGIKVILNQQTLPFGLSGFSGSSGSGASGFSGSTSLQPFVGTDVTTSLGATAFSASAGTIFTGRFTVHPDDGFFHIDGNARLVPHGKDTRGQSF